MNDINLSDAEWELMKVLWDCEPASVSEIAAKVESTTQWQPKIIRTMLNRLIKKGVVELSQKNNIQHYSSLYSREECSRFATKSFLDRVFDGSLTPLVAHFTKSHRLTESEKKALEKLLNNDDD